MTSAVAPPARVDPRPPFPIGWFMVCAADELAPGDVIERTWMGDQVVAFRTASGRAAVTSAFCPHLGADLARGGTVVGESLRCPFHSLRWSPDGDCVGSEYPGDPAYAVRLRAFPAVERFGFLFAWHDPAGGDPTFDIPDLDLDGWTDTAVTTIPIGAHVETVHENGVDSVHFGIVHGFPLSAPAYDDRGTSFHSEFHFATPNFLREGPPEITTFFDTDTHGLGYAHSLNTAEAVGLRYRVLLLTTPTTAGRLDFTVATTVQRPPEGDRIAGVPVDDVADLMHRGAVGGVHQDVPIWEGLRHVERPRLVKGDGPIPRFRHWASQFHPRD
ncbi:aromatic ring-hydroxylating oxygenase subunit alpha [Dermatobacter hominis]|uniref:aromatic ring-hydroxylating oxygenase subunit alpha n=1 Tax=Dermatobacter hominis TaxID=2884263 RepID=UPI001D0F8E73|nr:Rieske 2Fe-2S domain-containing protein [Dermatobacter hominis]UDY37527.1 Rieske (2Fe-2S) protein [Dermatobacter hominis]